MRLIRDWEKGGRGYGGGEKREVISLHCHRQNDSSIKIGSDESHFKAGFIVRDKVTRHSLTVRDKVTKHSLTVRDKVTRLSTNHTQPFWKRKESRSGTEVLPSEYQLN